MDTKLINLTLRHGDLTDVQVADVRQYSEAHDLDFLSAAYELDLLTESRCLELVQVVTSMSVVSLSNWNINDEAVSRVPESIVRACTVLPLHVFRTTLVVAVGHDDTAGTINTLREKTGLNIRVQFALASLIAKHIERIYPTERTAGDRSHSHVMPLGHDERSTMFHGGIDGNLGTERRVVAILESELDTLTDYRMALEQMAVHLEVFNEGSQLLRFVENARVDLVILGTTQFGLNALEVCRILKSDVQTSCIPIFLMTRSMKEREWQKNSRAKLADEFFEKPFDVMELASRVRKYIHFAPEWIDVSINDESMESSLTQSGASGSKFRQPAGEQIPAEPMACLTFSKTLEEQGATYQALEWLEKAVSIDPQDFNLRGALAEFYERHGYTTLAIDAWQNAMMSECTPEQAELSRCAVRRLKA